MLLLNLYLLLLVPDESLVSLGLQGLLELNLHEVIVVLNLESFLLQDFVLGLD